MDTRDQFIAGLPKAELHLHIEGSLEPELMLALAKRNGIALPFADVEAVRQAYAFSRLQDFLDIYYQGAQVLLTRADFHDLGMAYFERLAADGGRHAEIFFDPQTHTDRGLPFGVAIDGLLSAMDEAEQKLGVTSKLILCFLRHLDEDAAFETLEQAKPLCRPHRRGRARQLRGRPSAVEVRARLRGGGRAGAQTRRPCRRGRPPCLCLGGADLLHVDRIDHGNRSLEDDALVARLAAEQMTLTVCPLSNLKLCVVEDMAAHPIRTMLAKGLKPTINSDDPAYFGGYLNDNYRAAAQGVDLSREELAVLARNSFTGSFLTPAEQAPHLAAIDAYEQASQAVNRNSPRLAGISAQDSETSRP
jgi:adenosine deaminase